MQTAFNVIDFVCVCVCVCVCVHVHVCVYVCVNIQNRDGRMRTQGLIGNSGKS